LKLYEAMFLMDPQTCSDAGSMETEIRRILERAEAEVLICRAWEDRRLAYEIKGRRRGSYWLTYFKASPEKVLGIQRDVQLSEKILRALVLRCEQVPESELARQKAQAEKAAAEAAAAAAAESSAAAPAEATAESAEPAGGSEPQAVGAEAGAPADVGAETGAPADVGAANTEAGSQDEVALEQAKSGEAAQEPEPEPETETEAEQ